MPALGSKERTDPAGGMRGPDILRGERTLQDVRILRDHASRDVDLFELHARETGITIFAGDVDRPELAAHHAPLQTSEVRVAGGGSTKVVCLDVERRLR